MTNENCYLHGLIGEEHEVYESGICLECWRWAEDNFPPDVTEEEMREKFILENTSPAKPEPTIVRTILQDLGWLHCMTGGGCTAYSKATHDPEHQGNPEGWYWLLTDSQDPVVPTRANQMVTLGLYDHNGSPVIDFTVKLSLILYGDLVVEDTYA